VATPGCGGGAELRADPNWRRERRRFRAQFASTDEALEIAVPPAKVRGVIEIEVSGARIRVEPGVELATLSTVLSALRGIR
jgi:hypothetical protein